MAGSIARNAVESVAHSALPHAPVQEPTGEAPVTRRERYTLRFRIAGTLHSLADRIAPSSY